MYLEVKKNYSHFHGNDLLSILIIFRFFYGICKFASMLFLLKPVNIPLILVSSYLIVRHLFQGNKKIVILVFICKIIP